MEDGSWKEDEIIKCKKKDRTKDKKKEKITSVLVGQSAGVTRCSVKSMCATLCGGVTLAVRLHFGGTLSWCDMQSGGRMV